MEENERDGAVVALLTGQLLSLLNEYNKLLERVNKLERKEKKRKSEQYWILADQKNLEKRVKELDKYINQEKIRKEFADERDD